MTRNTYIPLLLFSFMSILFLACQSESDDPQIDCSASSLAITLGTVTNAECDLSNGAVSVSATGGSGDYTFSISGGGQNSTGNFTDLSAGTYTITVRDDNCSRQVSATVANEDGVIITSVSQTDSGCGETNGSITVEATDGVPPYEYALNGGSFQSGNVFNGLAQGTYTVRVNDSNDCEFTQEADVLSGISWENEVKSIIDSNCALPACHGGTQSPDFREFTNVQNNAENIKTRTQNGSMPPTGALPAAQVQAIACWVDDGAQNN